MMAEIYFWVNYPKSVITSNPAPGKR